MPREGAIAVVGATGAVGREALAVLASRGVDVTEIRALASARSAGAQAQFGSAGLSVEQLTEEALAGCRLAIFAADAETARRFVPAALDAGAFVVDNSSAFRMDPAVPLVVPEVNGEEVGDLLAQGGRRLVANPNCTTIILLAAAEPLRRAFGVEAIDVATYQAVSGAGLAGMEELLDQSRAAFAPRSGFDNAECRRDQAPRVFPEPCAFNVFSHDSAVDPTTGVNGEERKVIEETRKIWRDPALRVTPTCVRVPVLRAHTEAVTLTLRRPATEAEVRAALRAGEGIEILDDRAANSFPTPQKASDRDAVLVGRVRPDPGERPDAQGRSRRWCLLVCGDQIRKGAALNAIQIAALAGAIPGPPPISVPRGSIPVLA